MWDGWKVSTCLLPILLPLLREGLHADFSDFRQFLSLVKTVELSKKRKRKAAEESVEWVRAFKAQVKSEADVLNKKIEEETAASYVFTLPFTRWEG